MPLRLPALFLFFCLCSGIGTAQVFYPRQTKWLKPFSDTLVLDSLSLVPGSVSWQSYPQGDSIHINYSSHALVFEGRRPDSLLVSYTRFPFNFEKHFFHKDAGSLYYDLSRDNPFTIRYNQHENASLFVRDGLNKNGNISRGITFGNNQDVVVNSNLNLQVSGKLSPEIDLLMAATDNNIPFQADGTTAQLQEFDKVFIQLSNEKSKLIVGDYQLSRPDNSYFMNFYKRAQGIYADNITSDTIGKRVVNFRTSVAGAVSKGKFSRQVFFGLENNQGPYRLRGAENELFIVVLSGTERIYIDGKLLQRGQENDYIIDYNTAEIIFTARQLITKDKRIVAEFQYAERNYARSLFFFGEEISAGRTKGWFNFYNEQDNKNRPLLQTLSQEQKNVMIAVGDSLNQAFSSGAELAEFNNSDVFYQKLDTVVNGELYKEVYRYSTDPQLARYRLKFSVVGEGRGNYVQVNSGANGRVFMWVAPVNGIPQGSYEPIIPLVTPRQKQMLTAGFSHSLNELSSFGVEGSYTKNDINRFSGLHKRDDEGAGLRLFSKNQLPITSEPDKIGPRVIVNVQYEFLQQRFSQIERFRSIEFERDWNRPLDGRPANDQHLASAEVGLYRNANSMLSYIFSSFSEGNEYTGLRHQVIGNQSIRDAQFRYNGSLLSTTDNVLEQGTRFYRHKSHISQRIDKFSISLSDEYEKNLFFKTKGASLLPRAYDFWEWEGAVSTADSTGNRGKIFYRERRDKLAYGEELADSTFARNMGVQADISSIRNHPFTILTTYRILELKNVVGTALKPDNTLLNRLEYSPRLYRGMVTASIFYETGYGMENKREFHYIEVAPGQGQYTWIDYNNNGIKELNEFEVGQFADQMRYVRVYTPTAAYVKVLQNQLSVALNVRPGAYSTGSLTPLRRFINRWALQTALRLDNRTGESGGFRNYNPFAEVHDSLLLAANNNVRQSVFFNQNSAVFGADYTYINNSSRQLLTNGIENRGLESHELRTRLNFMRAWVLSGTGLKSLRSLSSQFFQSRNFSVSSHEAEGQLAYQPNTVFRIAVHYRYGEKHNVIGMQRAYSQTQGLEIKSSRAEKGSLTGKLDLIHIRYNDTEYSPVAYEMLGGLKTGRNVTWEVSYQRNLNNNLQVSVSYNGRSSAGSPVVHLGGAQVRAMF